MAVERRDIELILRAKDLSTKPFQDVAAAVKGLTGALDEQLQAATKGEISLGELRDTMRKLEEAGQALLKQQALIDFYRKLSDQLEAAKTKAGAAREAFDTMKAAQAASEEVTKKQTKELGALERAADRADKTVARIAGNVATQTERLAEAGFAVAELERHQQELANTAQETGAAYAAASGGVENYNRHIRELARGREESAKAARAEIEATRGAAEALREEAAEAERAASRREAMAKAERDFEAARDAAARRFRQSELEQVFTPLLDQQDVAAKAKLSAEQEMLRTLREEEALEQRLATRREAERQAELDFLRQREAAQRRFRQAELEAVFRPVLDAADAAPKLAAEAEATAAKAKAEAHAAALAEMREEEAVAGRIATNIERETRELERFRAAQAEVVRGFREAEFGRTFAPVIAELEALEAAERKAASEREAAAARATRDAERAARDTERQQAAFRQLSAELTRAATGMDSLNSSTVRLATAESNFAGTLLGVVDAAKQERETLEGLEQQLARFTAATADITKAIEGYEVQLAQIGAAQRELVSKAELIDSFRNQEAVVKAANAEMVRARETVVMYAKALANPAQANEEVAREAQQAKVALAAATREMQGQEARLQTLARAMATAGINTKALGAEEARLTAVANGLNTANERLVKGFERFGRSVKGEGLFGLTPYALQNIGFQLQDIFVQISAGTSVTQTLSQQLPQLFSAIPGAFGKIASYLPVIIPGLAAVVVGIAAVSRAMEEVAQRRSLTALVTASADGSNYEVAALEASRRAMIEYGVSAAEATEALRTFMDQGLRQDRLTEFGKLALDVADVTGKKVPDAARLLAEGFTGGWEALKKLNQELNFLEPEQAQAIEDMYKAGDAAGAQSRALDILSGRYSEAAKAARSEFTVALRELKAAWDDLVKSLADTSVIQALAGILRSTAVDVRNIVALFRGLENVDIGRAILLQTDRLTAAAQKLAEAEDRAAAGRLGRGGAAGAAAYLGQLRARVREAQTELERLQAKQGTQEGTAAARPPGVEAPSNARQAISDADYLAQQRRELEVRRQLNKEEAIARAGVEARTKAERAGRDAGVQNLAADQAMAAERRKIEESERNSLARLQETEQMGRRMSAEDRIRAAGDRAAREAERRSEGNAAEQRAAAERIERAKIAQEQQSAGASQLSAERELANQLSELRSTAARAERATLDQRLQAIDERYARIYQSLERFRQIGGSSVGGMSLDQFRAEVEAQKQILKNQETLKDGEERANALVGQRRETLRAISDQVAAGNITASQGYEQAREVTARIAEQMREVANRTIAFALALRGAEPNPRIDQLIEKLRALAGINVAGEPTGVDRSARTDANERLKAQQAEVRRRTDERDLAAKTFDTAAERGTMSPFAADRATEEAFAGTREGISGAIDELERMNRAMQKNGDISETTFARTNAEIGLMRENLSYVPPIALKIQASFSAAFANSMVSGFEKVAQGIAGVINGTQKWSDVFKTAGQAILTMLAEVLKAIAVAIIQFYALRIAKTIAGVFHSGGVVGSGAASRTREINPSWFIAAPRYHNGTSGAGLQPNEVPAILERGEEVLTKSDPRHVLNGGKAGAGGGGGGGQLAIRNVLVMDSDMIPQAMASSQGERVTVASIRKNAGAIRNILGVK